MKFEVSREEFDEVIAAIDTKIYSLERGDHGAGNDIDVWIADLNELRRRLLDDAEKEENAL